MITSKDELMKAFEKCSGGCDDDGCIYLEKANAITQKRYDNGFYCSCTCVELIALDVLELLKSQQEEIERTKKQKEPLVWGDKEKCGTWWYCCPECKQAIDYHDFFCRYCGQPLLWVDR